MLVNVLGQNVADILFNADLVEVWMNGLYTCLVVQTLFNLFSSRKRRLAYRHQYSMAVLIIVMYTISSVQNAAHWFDLRKILIVFGGSAKKGPVTAVDPSLVYVVVILTSLAFALNTLLADCLFIWRCWIIWGKDWRVILLPSLLTIVGTVFSAFADIAQIESVKGQSEVLSSRLFINSGTIYLSLSFATTLSVTLLVSYRILKTHWLNKSDLGDEADSDGTYGSLYYNVVEIVVESAALYSISVLVLLILLARKVPEYTYAVDIVSQITGIAPTLILSRISSGEARPSNTWSRGGGISPVAFASVIESGPGTVSHNRDAGNFDISSHPPSNYSRAKVHHVRMDEAAKENVSED